MFSIALQTIRTRWVSFVGMFIALTLGVALIGSMGLVLFATFSLPPQAPERFANATVVIGPTTPGWTAPLHVSERQTIAVERGISQRLADKLAKTGPITVDRVFYAQITGSNVNQIGHAWSSAAFAPYTLEAGRAPQRDSEVVTVSGAAKLNETVMILSATSQRSYKVVGLVREASFESPIFFTDTEAARLSPRINAIVPSITAEAAQQIVEGETAEVLTGLNRSNLDPNLRSKEAALNNISILTGIAAAVSGFIAIFVVASTFALGVAQRLREFALLRIIGALPSQIRRMVFSEALVIGVLGSALGCLLATLGSSLLVSWLVDVKFAPVWFVASSSPVPLILAFIIGLMVALLGVLAASYRASRVRPIEALRTAVISNTVMSATRWVIGLGLLVLGITILALIVFLRPRLALVPNIFINVLMLSVAAFALLSPIVIRPLGRIITAPFVRKSGAIGLLVRANTLTAVRRTAATVAPVLLTVGLTLSLLSAVATIDQSKITERQNQLNAEYVVTPQSGSGVSATTIENLKKVEDTEVVPFASVKMYAIDDQDGINPNDVEAVDPPLLSKAVNVELLAGSLDDFRDDSIIVSNDWGVDVGQDVRVRLVDDRIVTLRVAGIFPIGSGRIDAYVSQKFAGEKLANYAAVVAKTNDGAATKDSMNKAVQGEHVRVLTRAEWATGSSASGLQASWLGLLLTIGVTTAYSAIAIVNTMIMAVSGRLRDLSTLRLAGATPRQIMGMIAGEAVVVAVIGTLLAAGASAINFTALQIALTKLVGATPLVISWPAVSAAIIGSIVLIVCAATLPVYVVLRRGSVVDSRSRMNE